jgi:hypothetical protein
MRPYLFSFFLVAVLTVGFFSGDATVYAQSREQLEKELVDFKVEVE